MSNLAVHAFIACRDNYGYLVHDPETGVTVSIDAPSAAAIERELKAMGWNLTHILITHHDWDHVEGNLALKIAYNCEIIGPVAEADKIPGLDRGVREGDSVAIGRKTFKVLETPGHTLGHVSYWNPEDAVVFVGDTLFTMGCGRVKEGTHEMMWASLEKLAALPSDTGIYCGHEYAASNARFALTADSTNDELKTRAREVSANGGSMPTMLSEELATNPFLRANQTEIRSSLGMANELAWRVFGELRERKNRY